MSVLPDSRRTDGTRLVVAGATAVAVLVLALALAVLVWAAPRHQVDVPGPEAAPQQVAAAYVEAVAARDFDTARAIDAAGDQDYGRFSRPPTFRDVTWGDTSESGDTASVRLDADLEGGSGGTVADGRWTFTLERYADGRWRVVGVEGGAG